MTRRWLLEILLAFLLEQRGVERNEVVILGARYPRSLRFPFLEYSTARRFRNRFVINVYRARHSFWLRFYFFVFKLRHSRRILVIFNRVLVIFNRILVIFNRILVVFGFRLGIDLLFRFHYVVLTKLPAGAPFLSQGHRAVVDGLGLDRSGFGLRYVFVVRNSNLCPRLHRFPLTNIDVHAFQGKRVGFLNACLRRTLLVLFSMNC